MRESCTYGTVRGAGSNPRPYRDPLRNPSFEDSHRSNRYDWPMTNYRRNFIHGGSYFFTVNLADRRLRLLTEHIDSLRAAFRYTRARHSFTVEAMVVLPDHLHAIWTMPERDANFSLRWRLIKA